MTTTIGTIAKYVRSKNAGPFWVTIDIFFDDMNSYNKVKNSPNVNRAAFAKMFNTSKENSKIYYLPDIQVIKISVPRNIPQGGPTEYDMHAGQQYIDVSDLAI